MASGISGCRPGRASRKSPCYSCSDSFALRQSPSKPGGLSHRVYGVERLVLLAPRFAGRWRRVGDQHLRRLIHRASSSTSRIPCTSFWMIDVYHPVWNRGLRVDHHQLAPGKVHRGHELVVGAAAARHRVETVKELSGFTSSRRAVPVWTPAPAPARTRGTAEQTAHTVGTRVFFKGAVPPGWLVTKAQPEVNAV